MRKMTREARKKYHQEKIAKKTYATYLKVLENEGLHGTRK